MKRERRHELQTNALADWLAGVISVIKPYRHAILVVALVLGLACVLVGWWTRQAATGAEQAWEELHRAVEANREMMFANTAPLDDLVDKYPATEVAYWAAMVAADLYLKQGCEQVMRDKAAANQQLQKALEHYLTILKECREAALRERATFGAARTYEALSGTRRAENELPKAMEYYERLLQEWPTGPYAQLAARRLDALRKRDTKQFYDMLAQYEPRAVFPAGRPSGSGVGPLGPESVPEEPPQRAKGPGSRVPKAPGRAATVPGSSAPPGAPARPSEPAPGKGSK